jgi:hypothetical protein
MPPAPLLMADLIQKMDKNVRFMNSQGGGSFSAPIIDEKKISLKKIYKRSGLNSLVHLAYFQANRLLTELYKQETAIR